MPRDHQDCLPLIMIITGSCNMQKYLDKPAHLIIRLLFGFASDLTNSTNLQIVRRQCCLPATYFLGVRSQALIISLRIQTLNEHLER